MCEYGTVVLYDTYCSREGFDSLSFDKFRCIAVLGRGHFGKVGEIQTSLHLQSEEMLFVLCKHENNYTMLE